MARVSAPIAEVTCPISDQPHTARTPAWGMALVGAFTLLWILGLAQAQPAGTACNVSALPITGTRIVNVNTESALQSAVANAQAGDTIVIANGTYNLTNTLYLNGRNNVTIRGTSGCDGVVLAGRGMDNANYGNVTFGIWTNSLNTTIAHLTIKDTWENAIALNSGAQSPRIYSVKMLNIGSQFVKSNPTDPNAGTGVDNGRLEYSWMEYTAGTPSNPSHSGGTGYTQALSAHTVDNWIVRNNLIKNLHTPDGSANLWNPAILFWNHSQNNIVENNTLINTDRAIGMGLIDQATGTDSSGGTVRNNFVYYAPGLFSASRKAGTDGAIIANDSPNTKIYHNTILTNGNLNFSIEFRFAGSSGGEVRNNLADAPLNLARNGASAVQSGNYLSATPGMFVNPGTANLHLTSQATPAINTAPTLGAVTTDIDGNARPLGAGADIGADEYTPTGGGDTIPPARPTGLTITPQ